MKPTIGDLAVMRNLNEYRTKLIQEVHSDLIRAGLLDPSAGKVPPIALLEEILKSQEPVRTSLLNQLRNATFNVATSRYLTVRWDKANYRSGPVAEGRTMAVAIQILETVRQLNRGVALGMQAAKMNKINYEGNAPIMVYWENFTVNGYSSMDLNESDITKTDLFSRLLEYHTSQFTPVVKVEDNQSDELFAVKNKPVFGVEKQIETDYRREAGHMALQGKYAAPPKHVVDQAFDINAPKREQLPQTAAPAPVEGKRVLPDIPMPQDGQLPQQVAPNLVHADIPAVPPPVMKPEGM